MYESYYEDFTQSWPQTSPTSPTSQPARKPADELIPGTDAWIEAQAALKKREKKLTKRGRKGKSKTAPTGNKSSKALNFGQTNQPRDMVKTESDETTFMIQWYHHDDTIVLRPPRRACLEDWEMLFNELPKQIASTPFVRALKAWFKYLHG